MTLKEIEIGNIFTIENTPSYPKLRIKGGYVDMRDEIINRTGNCDNKECQIMTIEDLDREFKTIATEFVEDWVDNLKLKFLEN